MNKKIYEKVFNLVKRDKNYSISYIQRTLHISYQLANEILNKLESDKYLLKQNEINIK